LEKIIILLMTDLVSVIIPTKNRSDLILNAIKSVTSQTYKNIEIIIICDGCTDDTVKVLNKYFNEDNNIKIIALDSCVGAAEARNIGINNSKGEYIAFLDDDDLWENRKVEKQLDVFNNYSDTAIVTCYFSKEKNGRLRIIKSPLCINIKDILYENYPGSFSFCLVKKEYLNEIRIDKNLRKAQDWFLWINILNKSGKICRTAPEVLTNYNISSRNRITQKSVMSHLARIEFYRTVWDIMTPKQKYYNIRLLYNEKNSLYKIGIINDSIISLSAFIYHIKSRYNWTFYELLRNFAFIRHYFISKKIY